jgi:hypothetical protein
MLKQIQNHYVEPIGLTVSLKSLKPEIPVESAKEMKRLPNDGTLGYLFLSDQSPPDYKIPYFIDFLNQKKNFWLESFTVDSANWMLPSSPKPTPPIPIFTHATVVPPL